ncbi:uncharacterized protein BDV17DRAFT_52517 [Aspergillus undulatus]|uniref:uncharacterized protein n=1 Tax=Aspergillus undulatus TaxID=1810928 RepID=UPI003CCCF1FD
MLSPVISPIVPTVSFPASILPTMRISRSASRPFKVCPYPQNRCYPHLLCLLLRAFLCLPAPRGLYRPWHLAPDQSDLMTKQIRPMPALWSQRPHRRIMKSPSLIKAPTGVPIAMGQLSQTVQPPNAAQINLCVSFCYIDLPILTWLLRQGLPVFIGD